MQERYFNDNGQVSYVKQDEAGDIIFDHFHGIFYWTKSNTNGLKFFIQRLLVYDKNESNKLKCIIPLLNHLGVSLYNGRMVEAPEYILEPFKVPIMIIYMHFLNTFYYINYSDGPYNHLEKQNYPVIQLYKRYVPYDEQLKYDLYPVGTIHYDYFPYKKKIMNRDIVPIRLQNKNPESLATTFKENPYKIMQAYGMSILELVNSISSYYENNKNYNPNFKKQENFFDKNSQNYNSL